MTIAEAHSEFLLRVNKLQTNANANFFAYQIDDYLDRAQLLFIDKFYPYNKRRQAAGSLGTATWSGKERGFEQDQYNISALANLAVRSPEVQIGLTPTETSVGSGLYYVNLGDLTFNLIFPTKVEARVFKEKCFKTFRVDLFQQDDIKTRLNQPSFEFSKIHGNFAKSNETTDNNSRKSSIFLDTTNYKGVKQYDIETVYVSYIKRPEKPWLGTYNLTSDRKILTVNNKIYEQGVDDPVHMEIEEYFHDKIIDLAVDLAVKDWSRFTTSRQQRQS